MQSTRVRIGGGLTLLSEPVGVGRTEPHSSGLSCCKRRLSALADHLPLALGYRRHDVKYHAVGRGYVAGSNLDAALQQSADEVNVSG